MSGAKTDILFTLGKDAARTHGEWPDYLAYGFDHSDVAALLELVADQSLYAAAAPAWFHPAPERRSSRRRKPAMRHRAD